MKVHFRVFRSSYKPWAQMFKEAAEFASEIGEQRLINISQSADHNDGLITVWFWDK